MHMIFRNNGSEDKLKYDRNSGSKLPFCQMQEEINRSGVDLKIFDDFQQHPIAIKIKLNLIIKYQQDFSVICR